MHRELSLCVPPRCDVVKDAFLSFRVPFFFEPNFDAVVKPIPGALQKKAEETKEKVGEPVRSSVVYGDFLLGKVGNNFAVEGKDRYAIN